MTLAQRRWTVLSTADAIVEVCDSTPEGLHLARHAMRFVEANQSALAASPAPTTSALPATTSATSATSIARALRPPMLVQANKQDVPGALDASGITRALKLDPEVRVIEAVASTGQGVRETFVFALRAAREHVARWIETNGLSSLPSKVEHAAELHQRMVDQEHTGEAFEAEHLTQRLMVDLAEQER